MTLSRKFWESLRYPVKMGGGVYRRKRETKRQLVEKFYGKEKGMSPKIQTEVREGADDVTEGVPYEIVNVEEITTDVAFYKGIRVSLLDKKKAEGNVMLWQRKVTGTGSKLGVFIVALGNDTDRWLHKWVIFKVWQDRKRELEIIPAPTPKATKATTGAGVFRAVSAKATKK